MQSVNPLLPPYNTPDETVPFDKISNSDFIPAIEEGIEMARERVDAIAATEDPTFESVIEALEFSSLELNRVAEVFFNLNSAETNDEIQSAAREISPKLTAFGNDVLLNAALFEKVDAVYRQKESLNLSGEQNRLLEKTWKSFTRNGASLSDEKKEELRKLDEQLSTLGLQFGENVLADTHDFTMHLTDKSDLSGLPDSVIDMAEEAAKQRELEGWVFTLDYPSYMGFMTYADNRALRHKMWSAFSKRGYNENDNNNTQIVQKIADLRAKRAQLLGFKTHADFVLAERMAEKPSTVVSFLQNLKEKALPAAKSDVQEVADYAEKRDGISPLQRWDFGYYSEKLKKEKFDIDDEALKPYFPLPQVLDGAFIVAQKLYGITFEERHDIPKYNEEVRTFEVKNSDGSHLAMFYADFHPRKGKRNGAWMTSYRSQYQLEGTEYRPHISIVCNFSRPTKSKPALLTFQEVTTLFHEFGHALHGMLAEGTYPGLTGTSVYWDFVELPSQIMENWCYEPEALALFAKHYETGEVIPQEMVDKLRRSATFLEGYATIRQLSFGFLDMAWHNSEGGFSSDVERFEKSVFREMEVFPETTGSAMSTAFSHIFQGGYSAGYYSYKWAEVLDADAFESFLEEGLFNPETAKRFRKLLSSGGTVHPMELFVEFKGKEPDPEALLRRAGLVKA
ncbi:M3 family metallopeptidase [Phaeocystidibacter luteus]|uniref:M3 family metallopeptidase n=1 Tax=Phaeocystidibacter luteus TaxID=911197 RepID=A0A6N6RFA5_9FLAO|nr:M3 family metallopeptidase [Phaeocystidibacter luteus]KAB2809837.1 M3 family metallopeptidase [Phaeocystidibacter luteus]